MFSVYSVQILGVNNFKPVPLLTGLVGPCGFYPVPFNTIQVNFASHNYENCFFSDGESLAFVSTVNQVGQCGDFFSIEVSL